jgi:hypothetical protein
MATRRWYGRALATPQQTTLTPSSVSSGSTFTVTIDTAAVTVTATAATVANVTALLAAALQNSEDQRFQDITWEDETTLVRATGPANGAPFTVTLSAGGTGSPAFNQATPTAASGPNHWAVAANWRENAVPAAADDVIIDEGPSILYGLDQNAVDLTSLLVGPNYPADSEIGLPRSTDPIDPDGGYPQYLPQRLKIGATTVTVNSQSRRMRFDFDTTATTITVLNTGQAANAGETALDIIGTHANNVLRVIRGHVGVAAVAGDTAQFSAIRLAYRGEVTSDVRLTLGSGLTLATLEQTGGEVELYCAVTTYTKENGRCVRYGTGTITTLYNRLGEFEDAGTGTITTLWQGGDYTRVGLAALTVTSAFLLADGSTDDQAGVIVWTNAVEFHECSPAPGPRSLIPTSAIHYFCFGRHKKITIADI